MEDSKTEQAFKSGLFCARRADAGGGYTSLSRLHTCSMLAMLAPCACRMASTVAFSVPCSASWSFCILVSRSLACTGQQSRLACAARDCMILLTAFCFPRLLHKPLASSETFDGFWHPAQIGPEARSKLLAYQDLRHWEGKFL